MVLCSMISHPKETFQFDAIDDVLRDIAKGRMVIVTDDADSENEGELVMATEKVTTKAVNGRSASCGRAVRDFARRRQHGPSSGTDGVPQQTRAAHLHDPEFDRFSTQERKIGGAGANRKNAD